jgi:hypothetical protein
MRVNIKKELSLTHSQLLYFLEYEPVSGYFTWIRPQARRMKKGMVAGCLDKSGYWHIQICGNTYLAHRLAWLYMTGLWPKHQIDHKDQNRSNNSYTNLREATSNENCRNAKLSIKNTSGIKGVHWNAGMKKWQAYIYVGSKKIHVGTFDSIELANSAALRSRNDHHKEFASNGGNI